MDANFPEPNLPETSMAGWIFHQLKRFAVEKGKIAQIFADDGSSWTFDQLLQSSVHVAAGLRNVGINPGDMVSIVARNSHELYAIVLGCVMTGVVVTPSIPELSPHELQQNFLAVDSKFVIAGASFLPAVDAAIETLNPKPRVFEVQQLFHVTVAVAAASAAAEGALVDPATFKPAHISDPKNHIFLCMFSSGTTGKQKAVAMTDYGMLRIGILATPSVAVGPKCNASQINWVSWWYTMMRALLKGWARIFFDRNDAVNILDAVHTFKPTILFGSPNTAATMAQAMNERLGHWDLSSLRAFIVGGDIFSKVAHEELARRLKVNIYHGYGSTEVGIIFQSTIGAPIIYGSVGNPLAPIKLVDLSTNREITEPNKAGEIRVRWMIFHHYVNDPEATAEALDEKGWFKTGDIAYFDEAGNYFLVGRIKEMFKYCSYQVAPGELEDIIKKMPGVKDAAVVGRPAGEIGQLPTAFVIKSANANITERDIHDYLKKHNLHDSKRLRGGVVFTNELPRNVNGKIVRAKLQDLLNKSII